MRLAVLCVIAACGGGPAAAVCGDGIHAPGEVCDDGNTVSGDGCRADCGKLEICGDGILDDGEVCDDGNANPVDGCDACHPTRWSALAIVGGPDAPGDDGVAATAVAIASPRGLAIDGGALLVVAADRVRRVDAAGVITTVAAIAGGDGIALDGAGGFYIAEPAANRVRHVDAAGAIALVAGTGDATGALGDGGDPQLASLSAPTGLAVGASGALFIADTGHHAVRAIAGGAITTVAGVAGTAGDDGDGGPATAAHLTSPTGLAVDGTRLLIADAIRVRAVEGGTIAALAADHASALAAAAGTAYVADDDQVRAIDGAAIAGGGTGGDGGPATAAALGDIAGLAVDATSLYLADTAAVRRVDLASGAITTIAGAIDPPTTGPVAVARLADPRALAFAGQVLLVAGGTSGTVEAVAPAAISVVAGRYPQDAATGALARYRDRAFPDVGGVAVDAAASAIYLSETTGDRIDRIAMPTADPATWTIAPLANASGTAGASDGAAATATFRGPTGLYLDESRRVLYIADTGNHVIRALDLVALTVSTPIGTPGTPGATGDGGSPRTATLSSPEAVVRCASGDIFVADTGNDRVRRISASATPIITTVAADVDAPRGLGCDELGNLYFTSTRAVRVAPANDRGTVDGVAALQTLYSADAVPAAFPASATACLTGLVVVAAGTADVADACTGLLVQLRRE